MDNDNLLLRTARDLYKNARFGWRYRRFNVCTAQAGNDAIRAAILSGRPWLAARCGATEMRCAAEYLQNNGRGFSEQIRTETRNLSGIFPNDDDTLSRFCRRYLDDAATADLLALWDVGAERSAAARCGPDTCFTRLRALEPYYHQNPWSGALAGRRVLVVHPFAATITAQYQRREQLFPHTDILPEFAALETVQAVQGLAGQNTGYPDWFAALTAMETAMDAKNYDVAIIGAGAYGLPLAAHARRTGHVAVQMSGATQLLFGIRGRRWDDHPVIGKLYNPAWVRPAPAETVQNKEKVEGGSYW